MDTTDTANDPIQATADEATGNVDINEAMGAVERPNPATVEDQHHEAEDAWLEANDSSEDEMGVIADEAETVEADADTATAETTEPAETGERSPELADALAVLRRDGWDPEDLDTLDPTRILAMAEKRLQVQGDTDRAYQKLKELEAGETTGEKSAESEAVADTAEATSDSPAQDISEMVAPLAEALALDEDGTRTLVDFQKSLMAPLTQGFEAQQTLLQQTVDAVIGMQAETARSQLVDRFPQLQDTSSEEFKSVQVRTDQFLRSGEYDSVHAAMESAASVEFAAQARSEVARAKETVNRFQSNGQPSTHTTAPEQPGAMSVEDKENATLEMLESNDPNAKARARALWG